MSAPDALQLAKVEEELRQNRERFNQEQKLEARWFNLQLFMGYIAASMLPAIAVTCIYILLAHENFPPAVVISAGAALFADIVGITAGAWKMIFRG